MLEPLVSGWQSTGISSAEHLTGRVAAVVVFCVTTSTRTCCTTRCCCDDDSWSLLPLGLVCVRGAGTAQSTPSAAHGRGNSERSPYAGLLGFHGRYPGFSCFAAAATRTVGCNCTMRVLVGQRPIWTRCSFVPARACSIAEAELARYGCIFMSLQFCGCTTSQFAPPMALMLWIDLVI
jgi:hypothetical protein